MFVLRLITVNSVCEINNLCDRTMWMDIDNLILRCMQWLLLIIQLHGSYTTSSSILDQEYWYTEARAALKKRLQYSQERRLRAKNVVYFVADGMGLATSTAARILRGQRQGKQGEEHELVWDTFPAVSLAKTFNADAQIGESSACATALMCGVKANFETVGLDANGRYENCFSSFQSRVSSLIDWAQQSGKSTGIVTNTRVTHATPAALYSHSPSRYWEDDSKVPPGARKSCKDLTRQLVENDPGRNINIVLGGGRRHWLPKVSRDPEAPYEDGRRLDGRNLIDDWLRDKKKRGLRGQYVWNKDQLNQIDVNKLDYLLGLFAYSHMDFEADRDPTADPSLADMTRIAIRILQKNTKGFLLFVEGGRIDHAHHYNNAYRALDETLAMETALLAALELVNPAETLLVLTSDHSHVMTMGGQATPRGHPILGSDVRVSDVDGQPYNTLLYGNGPGYSNPRTVPANYTGNSASEEKNGVHGSAVPRHWATHGGEDVPVYALGPLATTLFAGTFDQTYIPHAIAYAACLGEYASRCQIAENYSTLQPNCITPEINSDTAPGAPVVGASSVMSDGTSHTKSAATACTSTTLGQYFSVSVIHFFVTVLYSHGSIHSFLNDQINHEQYKLLF